MSVVLNLSMTGFSLVLRGSVVALESSGVPTIPNNLRSHTPDRSSTPSDSRRVRVSKSYTSTQTTTHQGQLGGFNCCFNSLGVFDLCVHTAWWSRERCQCKLQWRCAWDKSYRPWEEGFRDPDHFCVPSLSFIRYLTTAHTRFVFLTHLELLLLPHSFIVLNHCFF